MAEHRADPDEDARIAAHGRQLRDEIGMAELAIGKAHQTRRELGRMHYEMSDDSAGRSAADLLSSARRSLLDAALVVGEFLRRIEDAEKDAELVRLRAEVDQLQQRLADHDCIDTIGLDDFDLAPGKSKPCHSPASHGYCGYHPPRVRCDNPDHHDHLGDGADPIDGEGSDSD